MSKLAERIRRAGRVESGPLGFGLAGERRVSPTMLCLLRLDNDQAAKTGDAAAAGAEAVIVSGVQARKASAAIKRLGDVPAGLRLETGGSPEVIAAREAGADFVALDGTAPAEAILDERLGFVLSVSSGMSDAQLRALAGLPLDALEVQSVEEPLTVAGLVELRRLSLLSQTPLLVEVRPDVEASRLHALRQAGVVGVILDGRHAGGLSEIREAVLSLPSRGRRREDRMEAVLPHAAAAGMSEEEEEPEIE